jgi:hypothetical protein
VTAVAPPAPAATAPKGSQPETTQSDRRGGGASAILALTCAKCGKSYNLGQDAVAVAPEVAFRALGIPTVGDMAGEPDLVSVLDAGSDLRGAVERAKPHLEFIVDALAKAQGRRWTCKACNTTQSYPATAAIESQRSSKIEGKVLGDDIPNDPIMSEMDAMMNAAANALGYQESGGIKFLTRDNKVCGIWVRAFPRNTTKRKFLHMYCEMKKQRPGDDAGLAGIDAAIDCVISGRYQIAKAPDNQGFNIHFLL